ncbi:MAG TPA: biotin--[acetyl-CoA-carboxylase] ligase [Terracidiphilus sp.]|nr:biotin--[acetyl-CoA-carboxylase] ligase [Terracidiphilus sp.]
MYNLATIDADLAGTIFAGKLHFSAVTGSTNTDALAAARDGAPHGSVFFTDEQTAGRGRGDHSWRSNAGEGLYVSVLLRPDILPAYLPMIPLVTGLAAAWAISVAGLNVDIRWPNDLLIGDRKTGGILVESKTDASAGALVVIGVGINVHQRRFDAGLSTPATSLDIESGRRISRQVLLIALLESLQRETWGLYDAAVIAAIPARVAQMSTWIWNRRVEVHGPQSCVGITAGLDANGFLLVRTNRGIVTVQTGGIRAAETE